MCAIRTRLSHAALAVAVTSHLAIRNSIYPDWKKKTKQRKFVVRKASFIFLNGSWHYLANAPPPPQTTAAHFSQALALWCAK